MELGICVRDRPADEVARLGRFAEDHGFGHVFVPDLRGGEAGQLVTGRDAFNSLAALFAVTTEVRAAVGVAAVIFHDPVSLARAAGTLNEASAGRFSLGVGVSHGEAAARGGGTYPTSPLRTMRWWLEEMTRCSRQGGLDFGGGFPVLLGALGPKMVALGASRADGLVLNWLTPEHARLTVESIGQEAPDRRPTTVLYVRISPPEAAVADAVAYDALANYHQHFVHQGLHDAGAIVAGTCLPADDPAAAADRLSAYRDAGVDVVCLYPHGLDEKVREAVLAGVADAFRG
jgi:alkanesulfonate monooxygenase SsuD/methylene tetrahydromethanopterin reductase-like flavin-dependent oxidoreductase (luciferase family)